MREKVRRGARLVAAATGVGTAGAAAVHGEFHGLMAVLGIFFGAAFVFLFAGALLQPWRRTNAIALVLGRCVIVAVLAIPASFFMARVVVAVELWCVKRYVETRLGPRLESFRTVRGQYPEKYVRFWEYPPHDAPWLIRYLSYGSDGRSYHLWVNDPGVCGLTTSYSSATRQWTQKYDPCWF